MVNVLEEVALFKDEILISTPYLPCRQQGCNFQYGPNFGVPLESNLSGQLICFLVVSVVVLVLIVQVCDQLIQAMRNSDPRSGNYLCL